MVLLHLCLFQEADVTSAVARASKLLSKDTNKKILTTWYRETCFNNKWSNNTKCFVGGVNTVKVHFCEVIP